MLPKIETISMFPKTSFASAENIISNSMARFILEENNRIQGGCTSEKGMS